MIYSQGEKIRKGRENGRVRERLRRRIGPEEENASMRAEVTEKKLPGSER